MLTDRECIASAVELSAVTGCSVSAREALVLVRRAEGYAYPNAHPKTPRPVNCRRWVEDVNEDVGPGS